jgi:hypothetical protein
VSGQVHDWPPASWLRPPCEGWIGYPVSRRVNSPKNDDPKLIEAEGFALVQPAAASEAETVVLLNASGNR